MDVGQHDSITFFGHTELLITRLLEGSNQLQVVSFSIDEHIDPRGPISNKSTSQIVWQARYGDREDPSKTTLTSALPLDLDSIIQGYCGLSRVYLILKLTLHSFQRTVVFVNFRWLKLRESLIVQLY